MDLLKRFLAAIAGSKKAIATLATIVFVLVAPVLERIGVTVTEDEINTVVAIAIAYIVGQGVADAGKEKAKIETAARGGAAPSSTAPPVA